MRILFDATRPVKTNTRRRFALGLLAPEKPATSKTAPFTAADLAFWAANAPSNAEGYDVVGLSDAELDRRAGESAWYDQFNATEAAVRKGRGVSLSAEEEASRRYNLPLTLSPEAAAERDADYAEWERFSAAYSLWLAGRGPLPYPEA